MCFLDCQLCPGKILSRRKRVKYLAQLALPHKVGFSATSGNFMKFLYQFVGIFYSRD